MSFQEPFELSILNLNQRATHLTELAKSQAVRLRIGIHEQGRIQILDFGVTSEGGLEAGVLLARICLGYGGGRNYSVRLTTTRRAAGFRTDRSSGCCVSDEPVCGLENSFR